MTAFGGSFLHDVGLRFRPTRQQGIALALGVVLGVAILVLGAPLVLIGMIGLILLAAAFASPEIVILAVLCLVLDIVPARLNFFVDLPVGRLQASDLLLAVLLSVVLFRLLADKSFRYVKTPLDIPLLLFMGAVFAALGTSVFHFGINFSDATYEARMVMYYLIFFAVTNLIRTRLQLVHLLWGMCLVSVLGASEMIIQVSLGRSASLMNASAVQNAGLIRSFHPAFVLIYIMLITLICDLALRRHNRFPLLHWLQILTAGASLLSTLTRNLLVSGAISGVLLVLILRKSQLSRLARNLVLIAAIAASFGAVLAMSGKQAVILEYSTAYLHRITAMFSAKIMAPSENLVPRLVEMRYAWARIVRYPIFGIGLYNPYRPAFYVGDLLRHYLHNAYLSIWLKTGLVGVVPFLWFSFHFLWRGFRRWRDVQDDFLRAITLGLTLAYFGMMLSNLVSPTFVQDFSVAAFGVILGIREWVLVHNEAPRGHEEGDLHEMHHATAPS